MVKRSKKCEGEQPPEPKPTRSIPVPWEPYVRCLEAPPGHPTWQDREWLRMDKFQRSQSCRKDYVSQYAHDIAKAIEQVEGGRWCGVIRSADTKPEWLPELRGPAAREWIEAHILDGPQGPSRRMIEANRGKPLLPALKTVPPLPPPKVATRAMLDGLTGKAKPVFPEKPAPLVADFDGPEFQGPDEPVGVTRREPGEDDPAEWEA